MGMQKETEAPGEFSLLENALIEIKEMTWSGGD